MLKRENFLLDRYIYCCILYRMPTRHVAIMVDVETKKMLDELKTKLGVNSYNTALKVLLKYVFAKKSLTIPISE